MLDRGHGERILRLHPADAARRPHDIGALDVRLVGEQVAGRDRHVHRLDHDAALPVQDAERVGELEDIAERLDVAVAPSALLVADVRSAGHRTEVDDVVADVQVARRVTRVQHEALGRVRELRLDQLAPQPHQLRGVVHQRAGAAIHLARRGAADLQARLLEHLEGGQQDAFDLLGRQDLERRPGIGEPRQRGERRTGGARRTRSAAAAGGCRSFGHGGFSLLRGRAQPPPPAEGGSCSRW